MSSKNIHFTPEFLEACQRLWSDGRDNSSRFQDGQYPDFKSFFSNIRQPSKTAKEEPSYEDMEKVPFRGDKCHARIEKYGYALQCRQSPNGDGCLCKTHQKIIDNLPEGATDLRYGWFNQPRPEKDFYKGETIKWGPKKNRENKSPKNNNNTSKMKVSEMRDFLSSRVPTEDFRHLKKKELFDLYTSVKNKEISSPSSSSDSSPKSTQPTSPETTLNDSQLATQQEVEDDGTGTGLHLSPRPPKTVSEYKTLFDGLGIDYSSIRGLRGFKQAHQDFIKSKEEEEQTQPMSDDDDDDDDLQEDKSSYQEMDFEGVSYLEDEDSGKIYNLKHQHVGRWNEDVDDIIWVSDVFKQTHEYSRQ
ncbi:MAG: hypothetical protein O3C01_07700 [Bacteroidetes bacterium]|nr:hypothetical protein [Bacteroidota bacterium]